MLMFFCVAIILIILIYFKYLHPGNVINQIPLVKAIVYAGVLVLTIMDYWKISDRTEDSLAIAVAISAIFEIVTNCQEQKIRKKCKKVINKRIYIVTVEEQTNEE